MNALDMKDRKILLELDANSRQSAAQIGRNVGLSKEVVNYRMSNLVQKKIVRSFYSVLNTLALGYAHYKLYFKFQNTTPSLEKEMLGFFFRHKRCIWLGSCSGNWDLAVSLLAESPREFASLYRSIVNAYGNYVLEKNVLVIDKAPTFNRAYLGEKIVSREFEYTLREEKVTLDDIDKNILSLITVNSRVNVVALMEKLHLSKDVISYRIKKMQKSGIIQGFRTALNLEFLGVSYYKILFTFKNLTPEKEEAFIRVCRQSKRVVQYIKLIGNWDAEVEFEVSNDLMLRSLLLEIRSRFSDIIRNTEQLLVYEKKLNYYPF